MTKAIAKTYIAANEYRRQIVKALFISCAFLAILYATNVYSVISRTVALQRIEAEMAAVSRSVEKLDSEYLAIGSQITPDSLGAHGFREGKVSAYISRTVSLGRATMAGHEL